MPVLLTYGEGEKIVGVVYNSVARGDLVGSLINNQ